MLKKLSLAALVAMGTMSVASASTDLSEAIKGVSLSGFLRYRYTEKQDKYKDDSKNNGAKANSTTSHEYKAVVKPTIKIDDKFSVHGAFVLINTNKTNSGQNDNTNNPFLVKATYLQYKNAGVTVKAGQQYLLTPLSDHDVSTANGLLATYGISGVTLAGGYFDGITSGGESAPGVTNNLYVLAAIANIKPVKVQAWYYSLGDKEDSNANAVEGSHTYFLEAAADVGPAAVKAQYAAKTTANNNHDKKQKFFAIAATGKVDVASVTAAYLKFGKDGSNVKVHSQADGLIAAGDILCDYIQGHYSNTLNLKDGYAAALVASAKVNGVKVGVQYVHATSKKEDAQNNNQLVTNTYNEYDLDVAYAYNKKLKFSGYYAILKTDDATKADNDITTNKIRFEAKYSF